MAKPRPPGIWNVAGTTMDDRAVFEVIWDADGNYLKVIECHAPGHVTLFLEDPSGESTLDVEGIDKLIDVLQEARRYLLA